MAHKQIDKIRKVTDGYMRKQYIHHQHYEQFAVSLIQLIVALLGDFFMDRFDSTKYDHLSQVLSKDDTVVQQISDDDASMRLCKEVKEGIHKWRFKILSCTQGLYVSIGIWKVNGSFDPDIRLDNDKGNSYSWVVNCKTKMNRGENVPWEVSQDEKYGKENYGAGDVIDMILDFDKLEVRYAVNEEDQGVAFNNIKQVTYTAAISMNNKSDGIEILEYSHDPL